jgi:uncharacterized repeat protein (TIGR03847 family)
VNYVFAQPDRVMVGVRGEVGNRLFLLQAREGRQLGLLALQDHEALALALWLSQVVAELGRPGHLPEDLSLEPEYEVDFTAGEIAVALDEEDQSVEVTIESLEEENDDTLVLTLSREWAGALAIAIARLVEAGRAPCPLCGGPLDPKGHDCPRTNGHRPPIR